MRTAGSGDGVHRPGIGQDIVEAREGDEVVDADGAVQADHGEEEARHDGGEGGPVGAETEAEDEERVERHRHDRAGQGDVHGALGVADGAQDARQAHAERQEDVRGQGDPEEPLGDARRLGARAEPIEERRREGEEHGGHDERGDAHVEARRAGEPARPRPLAGAERPRDEGADGDHQPDIDGGGEEQDDGGEAHARRQGRVAEPGDVDERQEVDEEDGDEPDGAGRRHDGDVAHGRAGDETRRRGGSARAVSETPVIGPRRPRR